MDGLKLTTGLLTLLNKPTAKWCFLETRIIAGLKRYRNIWQRHIIPIKAVSFGLGGDKMEHVLWRAQHMSFSENIKHILIHCGTNNLDTDNPEAIANGITSIGRMLKEKCRGVNIILSAILARDQESTSMRRRLINETNHFLQINCKRNNLLFLQHNDWVSENGTLKPELFYKDNLHLVEYGNRRFARGIQQFIVLFL